MISAMSAKQLPVFFPLDIRERLGLIAEKRNVPMAVIVREAVEIYLSTDGTGLDNLARQFQALITSPKHWPDIYQTLQSQIAATVAAPPPARAADDPPPPPPRSPTWAYQRPADAPSRSAPPPPADDPPPF